MKKYLIALAAICGFTIQTKAADTDLTALKNVLYVESTTLVQGLTQTLSLNLKNEVEVGGFQCKIYLPEGMVFPNDIDVAVAGARTEGKTFTATPSVQADGSLMIVFYKGKDNTIAPGDGQVVSIPVTVPSTMAVGTYALLVKETTIGGVDTEADIVETTLTISDRITLDENATVAPAVADGVNVKVLRTIKANEWSTICLPFAMSTNQVTAAFGEGVQIADFEGAVTDNDGKVMVNFSTKTEILANHPYIIKVSKDIASFDVDGVDVAPDADAAIIQKDKNRTKYNEFIGNYVAETVIPLYGLFLNNNEFHFSVGTTKMKAFRAYFSLYDAYDDELDSYSVKVFINVDGQVASVNELQNSVKADGAIFNLAGQRVSKAQKGIFIQNGKKTVIK